MTDMTEQHDDVAQTGSCECGATVTRTLPAAFAGLFAQTPFVCDPCIARSDEAEAADAEAWRRDIEIRRSEQRLRASGIPAQYADLTLDDMDVNAAPVAAARAWVDLQPRRWKDGDTIQTAGPREGSGLLLSGPVGVGKTHLAAAAAGTFIRRGGEVCWMSGPLLFARLQAGLGTPEHEAIIRTLTGRVPLVIDDIDKARPTAYGAENVFLAIDSRVSNLIPLIVTTNLDLAELAAHWPQPYGEAIASRLAGYCRHIELQGHDRRINA